MLICDDDPLFAVFNPHGKGDVLLVCEHATATIPSVFGNLGVQQHALLSHIAWDPGALELSMRLAKMSDANLCYQRYSRLLYDCNRPPESPSAIREKSEAYEIPGNRNLSEQERDQRVETFYRPFQKGLSRLLDARNRSGRQTVLVTVHSFTPVFSARRVTWKSASVTMSTHVLPMRSRADRRTALQLCNPQKRALRP